MSSVAAVLTGRRAVYSKRATGQPYNPANPYFGGPWLYAHLSHYVLPHPSARGREQIAPLGGHLFFGDSGITAANGPSIRFTHDAEGRIDCIDLPDGAEIHYEYYAAGA